MRKFLLLIGLIIFPTTINAQQIVTGRVSTFNDTEHNHTFSQMVGLADTSELTLIKTIQLGNMLATDDIGNSNYQYMKVGEQYLVNRHFVNFDFGMERLYDDVSGQRYQPIGSVSVGITPHWSNRNPIGGSISGRYAAFDEIGQYIRADVITKSINGVGEIYYHQMLWVQGVVDQTWMSDENKRFTTDITIRKLTSSGFFYGGKGFYRTYAYNAGSLYWSPEKYSVITGQGGYRFKWNDPTWQGTVTTNIGAQKTDNLSSTLLWSADANISRRLNSSIWLNGWGGYSNGNGLTGQPSYRSWTIGIGIRVNK